MNNFLYIHLGDFTQVNRNKVSDNSILIKPLHANMRLFGYLTLISIKLYTFVELGRFTID